MVKKKMLEFLYVQRMVQDINIYWGSFLRRWIGSKGFQNAIVTLSHPLCKKGSVSRALHCFSSCHVMLTLHAFSPPCA